MSEQVLGEGEHGELNLQSLEAEGPEDAVADQAAELERLKARMAELQSAIPGSSPATGGAKSESGLSKQPSGNAPEAAEDQAAKEEADARSVYVGNVDYECTPEELQLHFQSCGTVNRVTILTDKFGGPKGFAYVEFLETDAVAAACLLAESELRGRALKVSPKRTNVPGLKQRGRGRGGPPRGRGFGRRGGYSPYGYGGYGYRGRGRGRGGGYYGGYY